MHTLVHPGPLAKPPVSVKGGAGIPHIEAVQIDFIISMH
jgi:hypothetical protein